jgi:hypothetical protein
LSAFVSPVGTYTDLTWYSLLATTGTCDINETS